MPSVCRSVLIGLPCYTRRLVTAPARDDYVTVDGPQGADLTIVCRPCTGQQASQLGVVKVR